MALEENVKEFGLTYFGMTDRRQGVQIHLHPISSAQTRPRYRAYHWTRTRLHCTPCRNLIFKLRLSPLSSLALLVSAVILTRQVSKIRYDQCDLSFNQSQLTGHSVPSLSELGPQKLNMSSPLRPCCRRRRRTCASPLMESCTKVSTPRM